MRHIMSFQQPAQFVTAFNTGVIGIPYVATIESIIVGQSSTGEDAPLTLYSWPHNTSAAITSTSDLGSWILGLSTL